MGFFGHKKAQSPDEEVREYAGIEDAENLQSDDEEEFVRTMQDPSAGRGIQGASSRKNAILVLAIGIPIVIGMFLWFGYSTLKGFGLLSQEKQEEPAAVMKISDEEYARIVRENRELRERLLTVEKQSSNIMGELEKVLDKRLAEWSQKLPEERDEEVERELQELEERKKELDQVLHQIQESLQEKERAEAVPKTGSSSETTSFSTVVQWVNANKQEEEARRQALAEYKPPFDKREGVAVGSCIPGVLKTTLISSSIIDRFLAVAETTEKIEVADGYFLPAGARFLGKVHADMDARRLVVNINRLQFGSVDMEVEGILLDSRGNPGIVTKYIDPLQQSLWSSMLPNILSAAASAAQEMYDYVDRDGYYREAPRATWENAGYQGLADALDTQAQIMMEIQSRKKPVILAHSGIPVQIQLTQKLPLDILIEAGIVEASR